MSHADGLGLEPCLLSSTCQLPATHPQTPVKCPHTTAPSLHPIPTQSRGHSSRLSAGLPVRAAGLWRGHSFYLWLTLSPTCESARPRPGLSQLWAPQRLRGMLLLQWGGADSHVLPPLTGRTRLASSRRPLGCLGEDWAWGMAGCLPVCSQVPGQGPLTPVTRLWLLFMPQPVLLAPLLL